MIRSRKSWAVQPALSALICPTREQPCDSLLARMQRPVSKMNIDQLKLALTRDTPDPEAVIARLRAKQRVRRQRRLLVGVGGGMACVLGISIGLIAAFSPSSVNQPSPSPTQATGPVLGMADACGAPSFASDIAYAKSVRASVILARGRLIGKTTPDHVGGPGTPLSGLLFHEMELDTVKTLSGPRIADGSAAWILNDGVVGDPKAPNVPALGGSAGALWAPDGRLFAIVMPLAASGGTVGPTLRVAPVINDQVVFSDAGC
jgi:hypothetical protein